MYIIFSKGAQWRLTWVLSEVHLMSIVHSEYLVTDDQCLFATLIRVCACTHCLWFDRDDYDLVLQFVGHLLLYHPSG